LSNERERVLSVDGGGDKQMSTFAQGKACFVSDFSWETILNRPEAAMPLVDEKKRKERSLAVRPLNDRVMWAKRKMLLLQTRRLHGAGRVAMGKFPERTAVGFAINRGATAEKCLVWRGNCTRRWPSSAGKGVDP
jgi:hypothetical protein